MKRAAIKEVKDGWDQWYNSDKWRRDADTRGDEKKECTEKGCGLCSWHCQPAALTSHSRSFNGRESLRAPESYTCVDPF